MGKYKRIEEKYLRAIIQYLISQKLSLSLIGQSISGFTQSVQYGNKIVKCDISLQYVCISPLSAIRFSVKKALLEE